MDSHRIIRVGAEDKYLTATDGIYKICRNLSITSQRWAPSPTLSVWACVRATVLILATLLVLRIRISGILAIGKSNQSQHQRRVQYSKTLKTAINLIFQPSKTKGPFFQVSNKFFLLIFFDIYRWISTMSLLTNTWFIILQIFSTKPMDMKSFKSFTSLFFGVSIIKYSLLKEPVW